MTKQNDQLEAETKKKKKSKISWTEETWNPITGCSKISSGCKKCYAEKMTPRLKSMGQLKYKNGFTPTCHEYELERPYEWKKPRKIFVCSMSDLFHKDIPLEFIKKVFEVMNNNPQHTFQVLTKRADLLMKYSTELIFTKNIWVGVSVENQDNVGRMDYLKQVPAKIKWLSIEPLIGEITDIDLNGIDWVVVGGESGSGFRLMEESWVLYLRDKCQELNVPFFFKQYAGVSPKKLGDLLQGVQYHEYPVITSGNLVND